MTVRGPAGVVVLDLDDTLYLERDFVLSGFAAVDRALRDQGLVTGFASVARRLFATGRRGDIFDSALTELGVDPAPDLLARLVDVYRAHIPTISLAPDTPDFLDHACSTNALAIVTDGYLQVQRNKIAALRLDRWPIDPVVCTDVWGRAFWKPHRSAFDQVAAAYALPPDAFVYIADNPAKDFVTPRALGWKTIQIDRADRVHPAVPAAPLHHADLVVESFTELDERRLAAFLTPGVACEIHSVPAG